MRHFCAEKQTTHCDTTYRQLRQIIYSRLTNTDAVPELEAAARQ